MKRKTTFVIVVLGGVLGILAPPLWEAGAADLENSACIPSTDCAANCLVVQKTDATCVTTGVRCVVIDCTGGSTGFQYCQQATSGGPCTVDAGPISARCTGCTTWSGLCMGIDDDCSLVPSCGDPGGTGPTNYDLTNTCT